RVVGVAEVGGGGGARDGGVDRAGAAGGAVPAASAAEAADFVPLVVEALVAGGRVAAAGGEAGAGTLEAERGHVAGGVVADVEAAGAGHARSCGEGGGTQLVGLSAGRVVLNGAEAAVVEAACVVAGLRAVAEPIVLPALAQDAARERDMRAGRGATRVLLVGVAGAFGLEGAVPVVVATRILVADVSGTIEVVVLDLLGDGLGAVGPIFGISPVAFWCPPRSVLGPMGLRASYPSLTSVLAASHARVVSAPLRVAVGGVPCWVTH